jgi:WD40 repeat protein
MAKRPEDRYQTPGELAEALAPLAAYNPTDEATTGCLPRPPAVPEVESGTIRPVAPAAETMHPEGALTRLDGVAPGAASGSGKSPGDWSAAPVPFVEPPSPAGAVPGVDPRPERALPRRRPRGLLAGVVVFVGASVVIGAVALLALSPLWPTGQHTLTEGDSGSSITPRPQDDTSARDGTKATLAGPPETPKADTGKATPLDTRKAQPKDTGKPPPTLLTPGLVAEVKDGDAQLAAFAGQANALAVVTEQYLSWYDLNLDRISEAQPARCQIGEIGFRRWTYGVAITPEGSRVFYGDKVLLSDIREANVLRNWTPKGGFRTTPEPFGVLKMLPISGIALADKGKKALTATDQAPGDNDSTAKPALLSWDLTDPNEPKSRIVRFTRHGDHPVLSVALSEDGRSAVSSAKFDTVRWWDLESEKEKGFINGGNSQTVQCVAVSRDGKVLFFGDDGGSLHRVSFDDPANDVTFKASNLGSITAIALSADGSQIVVGTDFGGVRLWGIDGKELQTWVEAHGKGRPREKKRVLAVTLSSDGYYVYSVGADNQIHRWDTPAAERLRKTR